MIASIAAGAAPAETSSARESRFDDGAQAQSFAGVLSGVMNSHAPKPEPVKQKDEGTSELDKADRKDDKDGDSPTRRPDDPATATSTSNVVRSVAALDPTLQAKLARVMERVRDETGHDVQVAETYRSQARQDALYAQGRDTAGPVVTWTHDSKHTQGRAVDLVLDGGSAGPDAYQALQRIANEEGLRTLGAKDPGHLELPGRGTSANGATLTLPTEPADATGSGTGQVSIARVAQVARVAAVQTPQPAAVARVAAPGAAAALSSEAAMRAATKGGRGSGGDASSQSGSDSRGYSALSAAVAMRSASSRFPSEAVTAAAPSDAAARAEKVQAALDSAPARSLSQITMAVDAGNGTTDRIQLSMRGSSLSTTIDAADPRAAQAMTTHSDELVRSLSRDGVQVDSLRIRAATDTATSGIAAATGGQASQSSNDASRHSRFDRGNAWNQQQDHQERQRSQQDRRQQQRQRRGGQ